jgi:phosphoribosylformylglycinamidine synthase
MKYYVDIDIMPLKELLDPQGKAVMKGLQNMEFGTVENVRIGKHIQMEVEANSEEDAAEQVTTACEKLLANPVMEYFEFTVHQAN